MLRRIEGNKKEVCDLSMKQIYLGLELSLVLRIRFGRKDLLYSVKYIWCCPVTHNNVVYLRGWGLWIMIKSAIRSLFKPVAQDLGGLRYWIRKII